MRRRNDLWDKPWVTIAAVVGIIAVVIIALVFFMSGGNHRRAGRIGAKHDCAGNTGTFGHFCPING